MWTFLSQLKNRKVTGESLCEIEAAAQIYAKHGEQSPSEKGMKQLQIISKKKRPIRTQTARSKTVKQHTRKRKIARLSSRSSSRKMQ